MSFTKKTWVNKGEIGYENSKINSTSLNDLENRIDLGFQNTISKDIVINKNVIYNTGIILNGQEVKFIRADDNYTLPDNGTKELILPIPGTSKVVFSQMYAVLNSLDRVPVPYSKPDGAIWGFFHGNKYTVSTNSDRSGYIMVMNIFFV